MKSYVLTTMLGLTALLAACGQQAETDGTPTTAASEAASGSSEAAGMSDDMGKMAMPADSAAKMAKGTGTVAEIDNAAGKITLDHGPLPEANWPAMKMAFKAKPELLDSVKVGDKVSFELALEGDSGEVTAIQKQ
jgi:Cu/Ag efflux protein CusF